MSALDAILEDSDEGEEVESDYSVMMKFQEMLATLSDENYEEGLKFFKTTVLYQNQDFDLLVADEVISAFAIRPHKIKVIAKFVCFLKNTESFEQIFLATIFKPESDLRNIDIVITKMALLRECMIQGFTSIETIFSYIQSFMINFSNQPEVLFIAVAFFAPELEAYNKENFEKLLKYFEIFKTKCRSPQALKIYLSFNELRADSWKKLLESIQYGAPLQSIQAAIKRDDVDLFKTLQWSVNARIEKASFEVHPAAQCSLLPLQYAALFGAEKCVDFILANHPMILADESETSYQYERTEAIYDGKDSPEYERSVAYALALVGGNAKIVAKFSEMGFPTNSVHLYAAGYRLNYECKPDNATDDLFEAVKRNNIQCVLECIDMANLTVGHENNMTPAHIAALYGHSYVLQIVYGHLSQEAKEEEERNEEEDDEFGLAPREPKVVVDFFGRQPIHVASIAGHFDVVQVLMSLGCNPNKTDNFGSTCLSLAAKNGHIAIVNYLLQEGVNPNPKDHDSMTPLLLAASNGRADVCKLLVANEAVDVKAAADFGVNALHLAVQNGFIATFEVLMESGRFDINSKDMIGRTAIDFSQTEEMTAAIKKYQK